MAGDQAGAMDRMYRLQRHFYDLTRKYYLLGRDRLITDLQPPDGGTVLEIGCGTGRNLVAVAARYPKARVYGFDISTEMLKSAEAAIRKIGAEGRVTLAQGDATAFDARLFGRTTPDDGFDRVFISYSLSMIPDWRAALHEGVRLCAKDGRFAAVDFGTCARLPAFSKSALYAWLRLFHVTPRADLEAAALEMAQAFGGRLMFEPLYRGYASYVTIER